MGLIAVSATSGLFAAVAYIVTLPFVIFGLKNPFYRRRFEAMFRIKASRNGGTGPA